MPIIIGFGETIDKPTNFKVVAEKDNIFEMPSLFTAIQYRFAIFYNMNIAYPKEMNPLMMILETELFGLKASAKMPVSVTVLRDKLSKC